MQPVAHQKWTLDTFWYKSFKNCGSLSKCWCKILNDRCPIPGLCNQLSCWCTRNLARRILEKKHHDHRVRFIRFLYYFWKNRTDWSFYCRKRYLCNASKLLIIPLKNLFPWNLKLSYPGSIFRLGVVPLWDYERDVYSGKKQKLKLKTQHSDFS